AGAARADVQLDARAPDAAVLEADRERAPALSREGGRSGCPVASRSEGVRPDEREIQLVRKVPVAIAGAGMVQNCLGVTSPQRRSTRCLRATVASAWASHATLVRVLADADDRLLGRSVDNERPPAV